MVYVCHSYICGSIGQCDHAGGKTSLVAVHKYINNSVQVSRDKYEIDTKSNIFILENLYTCIVHMLTMMSMC
jgi:hypothetical protein